MAKRRSSAPRAAAGCATGFRLGEPAGGGDVELDLAAGADDQHAAGRHRDRRAGGLHRLARPQALQDQRRLAGIGRRADPGVDAEIRGRDRALPVERGVRCASCGRRRRRRTSRSPAPARARAAPSDRARRRAASASRPASVCAERSARSICARHSASACRRRSRRRCRRRSWWRAGAGRPELRSSRRSFSVRVGSRSRNSGSSAAAAIRQNTPSPMARPIGGSHSHSPSQDTARNRPTAVAIDASAGHSRSHRIVQRARVSARSSIAWPGLRRGAARCFAGGAGTFVQVRLQQRESAAEF